MSELTITSITPAPDDGNNKVATVSSSWGDLEVRYAFGTERGSENSLQFFNSDLSQLTPPAGRSARVAGSQWIAAVSAAILAARS